MKRLLCLLLILAPPASAAQPVARLAGPARVEVRGQILLDASGSASDVEPAIELARGPAAVAVLPLYDRQGKPVFALASPPEPGTYMFILIAEGTPDGGDKPVRAFAFHEVTVDQPLPPPNPPKPPPAPTPGPAPAPTPTGLAAFVTGEVAKVNQPADHRAAVAKALAAAYRSVASQAAAGIYQSPADVLTANKAAVRDCLGGNLDAWKPFLDSLKARLDGVEKPQSVDDLVSALNSFADGLEAVK